MEITQISADQELAEILLAENVISKDVMERVKSETEDIPLREALIGMNICVEDQINWALSKHLRIPFILLNGEMIDKEILQSFPPELLIRINSLPIPNAEDSITLVMSDPLRSDFIKEAMQYVNTELQIAIGPQSRITSLLKQFCPIQESVDLSISQRMDYGGVSSLYRMLIDARKRYCSRILIRPSGEGLEAAFRLERGWVIYKAWTKSESHALITRARALASLSAIMPENKNYETSTISIKINKERLLLNIVFIREDYGMSLSIDLFPIMPCESFLNMNSLLDNHKYALSSLFTVRRPTGVIIVNTPDNRQRHRMTYGIISALSERMKDIISIDNDDYFTCLPVRKVKNIKTLTDRDIIFCETIAIPNMLDIDFKKVFQWGGRTLVILGTDFANSSLTMKALMENIELKTIIADRLRAIWNGRRVLITCSECGGVIDKNRGLGKKNVCKECDGFGTLKGKDIFELLISNDSFRDEIANINGNDLHQIINKHIVEPTVENQLKEGIENGSIFALAPEMLLKN